MFGQEVADQFTYDVDATSENRRTIEIKQKLGTGGTTTFTQLGRGEISGEFTKEIESLRQQANVKVKPSGQIKALLVRSKYFI